MTNNQPSKSPASAAAPPARFRQTGKMPSLVFGDDVFISYSRRRGAEYALAVRNLTVEEWNRTFPTQPYRKFFEGIR